MNPPRITVVAALQVALTISVGCLALLFALYVGGMVAVDAAFYLVPKEGCDSGCWQNSPLMRGLGVFGLFLGAAVVGLVPAVPLILRTKRWWLAIPLTAVVVGATAVWVPWTNALLDEKGGGGGLNLFGMVFAVPLQNRDVA